jgi:hypothetical protein
MLMTLYYDIVGTTHDEFDKEIKIDVHVDQLHRSIHVLELSNNLTLGIRFIYSKIFSNLSLDGDITDWRWYLYTDTVVKYNMTIQLFSQTDIFSKLHYNFVKISNERAKNINIDLKYPESTRLKNIQTESEKYLFFLKWLQTKYAICEYNPHRSDDGQTYSLAHIDFEKLLAKFFDIDLDEVEKEKVKMIQELSNS